MRKTVSVADLKRHLSGVLGEVAHGRHVFIITRRGRPMARLVPIEQDRSPLADVVGWLDDSDPFFKFVREAENRRGRRAPRAWGPAEDR